MSWVQRLFCPPSPQELGRTTSLGLPSRRFGGYTESYAWEDWEAEVRRDYPVRYFLSEVLWPKLTHWPRLDAAWYRLKCTVLPKYRGYSVIDLRQAGPGVNYTHGWVDRSDAMLYACFICLRQFVENEAPHMANPHDEEDEVPHIDLTEQRRCYDEMWVLYNWWMSGQLEEEAEEMRLYKAYDTLSQLPPTEESEEAKDAWLNYSQWRKDRTEEMLARLVRIRGYLWT